MKAIKVPKQNAGNRLSEMQLAILAYMIAFPAPSTSKIGHLPTTGEVIDGLGLQRNKITFASVSRSLSRLEKSGRLFSWVGELRSQGGGFRWSMPRQQEIEQ